MHWVYITKRCPAKHKSKPQVCTTMRTSVTQRKPDTGSANGRTSIMTLEDRHRTLGGTRRALVTRMRVTMGGRAHGAWSWSWTGAGPEPR